MRQFLYRLSWDKEYKRRTIIISLSCISFVAICIACVPLGISIYNSSQSNNNDIDNECVEDNGTIYDLKFKDREDTIENKEDNKSIIPNENKDANTDSQTSVSKESQEQKHEQPIEHVHSWHLVIDSQPWDETVYIQTGTRYICRNCGYACDNSSLANVHSSATGHGFRTEPIIEQRIIHHPQTSHLECSCGARM